MRLPDRYHKRFMSTIMKTEQVEKRISDKTLNVSSAEIGGRTVAIITIDGLAISISGGLLRTARVRDEPYECLSDAEGFVAKLQREERRPDLFTFMQPIADQQAHHPFYHEWENLAVLRITTYQNWWKKQIKDKTRNLIRKAEKKGVEVRRVPFDDELVRGVKAIYDECPLRQGKPFWHYHKDYETIKKHLDTFLDCSDFLGAFWGGELIGYIKMTSGNGTAGLMQILSRMGDRDKAPTNALMAKAVELCAERKISYLHYGLWSTGNFAMFKQNHAFERHQVPRYFVPLTLKGRLMLKLGLHRNPADYLPPRWHERAIALRDKWYSFRYGDKKKVGAVA